MTPRSRPPAAPLRPAAHLSLYAEPPTTMYTFSFHHCVFSPVAARGSSLTLTPLLPLRARSGIAREERDPLDWTKEELAQLDCLPLDSYTEIDFDNASRRTPTQAWDLAEVWE